jgi:hypothetical protein
MSGGNLDLSRLEARIDEIQEEMRKLAYDLRKGRLTNFANRADAKAVQLENLRDYMRDRAPEG